MERTCELIRQAKEGNKKAQEILVEENDMECSKTFSGARV